MVSCLHSKVDHMGTLKLDDCGGGDDDDDDDDDELLI